MKERIMRFLEALEAALPPPPDCHYALMLDSTEPLPQLSVQMVFICGSERRLCTVILCDGDLDMEPADLVSEIVDKVKTWSGSC